MKITISNNTVDGVKGGVFNLNGKDVYEMQARIEQLEKALVDLGVDHGIALNNLATEKALADDLYIGSKGYANQITKAWEAYRKARGL